MFEFARGGGPGGNWFILETIFQITQHWATAWSSMAILNR